MIYLRWFRWALCGVRILPDAQFERWLKEDPCPANK
jgi:hypothetical protein